MSNRAPFATIPVNAEEHFRLVLLGQILEVLERERKRGQLEEYLSHFAFLHSYADRIATLWQSDKLPLVAEWREAVADWQGSIRLPLDRLANFAPGAIATTAVVMSAAIEEDPRFSLLIEAEGGAPTLGGMTVFLNDMFPTKGTGDIRDCLSLLSSQGILAQGGQNQPRIEWTLRVTQAAFETLTGANFERRYLKTTPRSALPDAKAWIPPSDDALTPASHAEYLIDLSTSTTLIRGDQHNGRMTFLRMAAREANLPVIQVSAAALSNEEMWQEANLIAALSDALLMIECTPGLGERITIAPCPIDAAHLAIATTYTASVDHGRPGTPFFPIDLPRPDQAARAKHWRAAGWSREAKKLSERVLTSGHIHRVALGADRKTKAKPLQRWNSRSFPSEILG